jgi:hypothetical protein
MNEPVRGIAQRSFLGHMNAIQMHANFPRVWNPCCSSAVGLGAGNLRIRGELRERIFSAKTEEVSQ